MKKKTISLMFIYKTCFFISLMTFIMRQAIPMRDLFWTLWVALQFLGVIIICKSREEFNLKDIINSIIVSKKFTILLTAYVIIDFINMFYGPAPILSLSKYIVFVEGISYILHAAIICNLCECTHEKFLSIFSMFIIFSAILAAAIALFNFYFPIFGGSLVSQISIIDDYNAFCRYFLFSYIVGFIFICQQKQIAWYKKLAYLFTYSLILCVVMLMSTSRRTLLTLAMFIIILIIYYFINLLQEHPQKEYNNLIKKTTISILLFVGLFFTTVEGSNWLLDVKNNIIENSLNENIIIENEEPQSSENEVTEEVSPETQVKPDSEPVEEKTQGVTTPGGVEQISNRIEIDNFWGQRSVIWDEAIKEVKKYNIIELLFGKGAGYATKYYEKDPTASVISDLYGVDRLAENSMYPHNFILQDIMEGGIIKGFLSILLTIGFGIKLIVNLVTRGTQWLVPILSLLLIGTNIMISYSYGFLGDVYYNVTILLIIQIKLNEQKGKKILFGC